MFGSDPVFGSSKAFQVTSVRFSGKRPAGRRPDLNDVYRD